MVKRASLSLILMIALLAVALFLVNLSQKPPEPGQCALKVLSYSSFVSEWGPGPAVAKAFEVSSGCIVEFHNADDAGLLLSKLQLFPADVVLGFDQFSLDEARAARAWKTLNLPTIESRLPQNFFKPDFAAFDWGPMAFVYRKGEVEPPRSLDDLLDARFSKTITLQDPRTSSPGLQFFFWVLRAKGVDEGFQFLKKLKSNLHSVSASWSSAYGLFQKKQAKLAFSYLTSPVYHWVQDKDETYQAAVFSEGHPIQVEYAGVPESCTNCDAAQRFLVFLQSRESQIEIMQKNFMLPVLAGVETNTLFAKLPDFVPLSEQSASPHAKTSLNVLLQQKTELLDRWMELGL